MASARTIVTRIVLGAVLIAAVAGVFVLDYYVYDPLGDVRGIVLGVVVSVLIVLGFREFARLARAAGTSVLSVSGTIGAVVVASLPVWGQFDPFMLPNDLWALFGAILVAVFLEQMVRHRVDGAIGHVGATLLGVLYLGAGSAALMAIRMDPGQGIPRLVLVLVAVKATDIGAYLVGTAIGRHKLIPWLSPGKSWEGLVGGLAAAAGASVLTVWVFGHWEHLAIEWTVGKAAAFGAIVGLAGQFADLCESLLKRSAGVKDSAALLPAFGGVLDIIDSPLLAGPVAYVLLEALR